jgi:GT2 family glycosyltransferase
MAIDALTESSRVTSGYRWHKPELSVVICTLGNYSGLKRVLDRLSNQDASRRSFEVIVVMDVADPKPDAVERAIGERPYAVRLLSGTRPGLSANRNVGWRAAKAPLLLFTDNDTLGEPQLVSEHLEWHRRHTQEEVAVLGHVRWAREIRVTPFMHWLDHGFQFDYPNIQGIEAGWGRFYGANVSAKRSFVERVGGFDEERMPYLYDDLDFGYRASKHGLRLLYNRRAVVEHLREMDLSYWRSRMKQVAHAEREFVRIHPELAEEHPDLVPYFFRTFSAAAAHPPIRGRGRHLIRLVPRRLPWLGPRAWGSADLYYRQALAPEFLAAWDEDASEPSEGPVAPYLLEREAVASAGAPPAR